MVQHTQRSEAELCMLAYPYSKQLENNIIQRLGPAADLQPVPPMILHRVQFVFSSETSRTQVILNKTY